MKDQFVVTGGSGFCGGHFVEYAAKQEPDRHIVIFDIERPNFKMPPNVEYFHGDIRYSEMLEQVVPGAKAVFDFAGYLGTSELFKMKSASVDVNIKGATNVLESCRVNKVPFVYHPTKNHFQSDHENMYTITKFTAEKISQMYKEVYDMSILVMRFLNVTGPRQHLYPIRKFVPLASVLALMGMPIEVYGDGEQTVDIVDVRDVARLIYEATFKLGKDPDILEVGYGFKHSVNKVSKDIVDYAKKQYGSEFFIKGSQGSEIMYKPMRMGEKKNTNLVADLDNLHEKLPEFNYKYTYEECIAATVDYYAGVLTNNPNEVLHTLQHFSIRDAYGETT